MASGIIFLGTGPFGAPTLRALVDAGETISLVVTQPDRPKGRGRKLEPTPIKKVALELGLEVYQPGDLNSDEPVERLTGLAPEFLVLVDYGQLLKARVLNCSEKGPVNLHPSLLPLHRGPSPIASAIMAGDTKTGASTMLMDEGMDTGALLLVERIPLSGEETRGEIEELLSERGGKLVVKTLAGMRDGSVTPTPQDHSKASISKMIDRAMQELDWTLSAAELAGRVNGLSPRPGCRTRLKGKNLKILKARALDRPGEPGVVSETGPKGVIIGCGVGSLLAVEVLPEGKRRMGAAEWARGKGVEPGDLLGNRDG